MALEKSMDTRAGGEIRRGKNYDEVNNLFELLMDCKFYLAHQHNKYSGQGKILTVLSHEKEMEQVDLQYRMGIKPGSMSEVVGKLVQKGYILRTKSERDSRKKILKITEAGMEANAREKEKNENDFDCLGEEEKEELRILLRKLLKHWHQAK